ncbi:hypothetical protein EVA_06199 [gut metagenome]|uniref:Uncharacterized protein n=1 Tax=gut metagenome TaxID=749906 RepID=J9CZI9_9ZZZZ
MCFKERDALRYNELIKAYEMEGCVSERTAKSRVQEAKMNEALSVQNGLYSLEPK